ncbi:hypothetical protein HFO07_03105 [Rhizobium leguminosarum]|uniref:hypothetical protein n=1 Tax=Rhizobium leguminosarum TaxID=384 RepID=UPI001C96DAE0|nr:hypothetical protein [Rhizobium leguminosarum]MBY5755664.1 hypothetical protein [Rhizobium leguminosarum]
MISPPALALRRRAEELHAAAARELQHDPDTAALLLFYAAECGLKSIYMVQNSLKDTADARGAALPATSFLHNILRLADALRIPKSVYAPNPSFVLQRGGGVIDVTHLHQAWRYGERLIDTHVIYAWLLKIFDWIKRNR